jgi:hypothetical protein
MTSKTARSYLVYQLQSRLYSDFYIRGSASASYRGEAPAAETMAFARTLSTANAGTGCRENGWAIVEANANEIAVSKGGPRLHVHPSECSPARGVPVQKGCTVALHLSKELLNASPGYYMTLGNCGNFSDEALPLVRLYWNLKAAGATRIVDGFTRLLNHRPLFPSQGVE